MVLDSDQAIDHGRYHRAHHLADAVGAGGHSLGYKVQQELRVGIGNIDADLAFWVTPLVVSIRAALVSSLVLLSGWLLLFGQGPGPASLDAGP